MTRLPWTVVRHTDLDEIYSAGRAAGLAYAERLLDATLAGPVERGDQMATAALLPLLQKTLADERSACLDGVR